MPETTAQISRRALLGAAALGTLMPEPSNAADYRIIDPHVHVWKHDPSFPFAQGANVPTRDAAPETLLDHMKANGVSKTVLIQVIHYRYDNSYILDSSDRYPEQMMAVVILDAEDEATPALMRTYVKDHGLAGLRLFGAREPDGSMPWLKSAAALKSWDVAQEFGLVMDLEVLAEGGGGPSIPALITLARKYPGIRLVLDHLLEPEMDEGEHFGLDERWETLAPEKNVFFKFTSINLDICRESGVPATQVLRRAVDLYGADRVMWGSDIGTSSGTYKDMVQRMVDASVLLSPAERQAVFHDTGRRVFIKGGSKR